MFISLTLWQCFLILNYSNVGSFHPTVAAALQHLPVRLVNPKVYGQCHRDDHIPHDGFQFPIASPTKNGKPTKHKTLHHPSATYIHT